MVQQKELLLQMGIVIDQLIDNANKLNEAAKRKDAHEVLDPLQTHQHEILSELAKLDLMLKKSALQKETEELRKSVKAKLQRFQKINEEFLSHVSHHHRLIQKKGLSQEVIKDLFLK